MKVAISTSMPVSKLLSHIQNRRRRSRALAAYANYAATNFGPSSARGGPVNAYCVALMHSIPTSISASPSTACLPASASFGLDSSQENKTYANKGKVFDEGEDKDDAILITALPSLPFCCHADLILMARPALISVADHINAYLPGVTQIPVGDDVKSEDIRRIIEEMVGLREKGGAAQRGGAKSGRGIGRTIALESSNSFFGPQGTHRPPGKSVTFARPLFASLDNASNTSITSPIIDSSSLHQSPTPAPSNPHSHAPSTSDMSIATSYGAPIVSSLLPGSFSQLSQYTSHTQSQSQSQEISGSGSVLFQCQSVSQIGSPTPTPPRSHSSYPQPQSLPVSPPRSHSRRGLLSPGRSNGGSIPLNPSLSTPIISSYSHRFTTSFTSPALSQSLWSIPEAFLPHAPEFDLETALSLRRNEDVDLGADFGHIGGVDAIDSGHQVGVEDQVESAIGEGRVDARARSWGRTSVLRRDSGESDCDESADDEEGGVGGIDVRLNESKSVRGGRAEENREGKTYEAGEGGNTSDTDTQDSASASGTSEIGEEEGTATETEDECETRTDSENDIEPEEQEDDGGVGSEDEREGMVVFGEARAEDQCARKAMYEDEDDKKLDGRLLQSEVQQQASDSQFGENKELSASGSAASEFGLGLDESSSLVDVVTTRVHPSSTGYSASSQDEVINENHVEA